MPSAVSALWIPGVGANLTRSQTFSHSFGISGRSQLQLELSQGHCGAFVCSEAEVAARMSEDSAKKQDAQPRHDEEVRRLELKRQGFRQCSPAAGWRT